MAEGERRRDVVVVCEGVVLLDLAGPVQVLGGAGGYRLRLASLDARAVRSDTGGVLNVDSALSEVVGPVDTVVVPGPPPGRLDRFPPALVAELRRLGGAARRVTSVCTGAFLLAAAGVARGELPPGEIRHQRHPELPYVTWDMVLDGSTWGD